MGASHRRGRCPRRKGGEARRREVQGASRAAKKTHNAEAAGARRTPGGRNEGRLRRWRDIRRRGRCRFVRDTSEERKADGERRGRTAREEGGKRSTSEEKNTFTKTGTKKEGREKKQSIPDDKRLRGVQEWEGGKSVGGVAKRENERDDKRGRTGEETKRGVSEGSVRNKSVGDDKRARAGQGGAAFRRKGSRRFAEERQGIRWGIVQTRQMPDVGMGQDREDVHERTFASPRWVKQAWGGEVRRGRAACLHLDKQRTGKGEKVMQERKGGVSIDEQFRTSKCRTWRDRAGHGACTTRNGREAAGTKKVTKARRSRRGKYAGEAKEGTDKETQTRLSGRGWLMVFAPASAAQWS
ncbi:hypothetical protein C8F01DRAFT_1233801 [Mycena amicta]|nr:hypothetical protein C8F01DRAFT_1233801 [Mycena amicta]